MKISIFGISPAVYDRVHLKLRIRINQHCKYGTNTELAVIGVIMRAGLNKEPSQIIENYIFEVLVVVFLFLLALFYLGRRLESFQHTLKAKSECTNSLRV